MLGHSTELDFFKSEKFQKLNLVNQDLSLQGMDEVMNILFVWLGSLKNYLQCLIECVRCFAPLYCTHAQCMIFAFLVSLKNGMGTIYIIY